MKKYVILTPSICRVGGAEEYINRKVSKLEKAEFKPYIFYSLNAKILIPNLQKSDHTLIEELGLSPFIYSPGQREKILKQIISHLNILGTDEIYIESTEISMCEWGELLAEETGGKHVCIILQEKHNYPNYFRDYLLFKYQRQELYGINVSSVSDMLPDHKEILEPRFISADCNNVVDQVECPFMNELPDADYTIGSIGRLEKHFTVYGAQQVAVFAKEHSTLKFNVIMIGDGPEDRVKEIQNCFSDCSNVHLHITGYMYPIPEKLIKAVDCFYSSAGSARVSTKMDRPTVTMSADGEPLGIMNYTTQQTLYKDENYIRKDLSEYLQMILLERFCETHPKMENSSPVFDSQKEFVRQIGFFNLQDSKQYYPLHDHCQLSPKNKIYRLAACLLGSKYFVRTLVRLSNWKKSLKGEHE